MTDDTPSRHACHCGKSFIRKEHLRRHEATHNGRSFQCSVCDRSFTRNDLLRRHSALHDTTKVSRQPRREKACDTCHANKTKCSGGPQCSLCARREIACVYSRGDVAHTQTDTDGNGTAPDSASTGESSPASPVSLRPVEGDINSRQQASFSNSKALEILLRIVSNSRSASQHECQTIPRLWLRARIDSFTETFHRRWPILHVQLLDECSDSPQVIATVVIIDLWHLGDARLKGQLLKIYAHLAQRLSTDLNESGPEPTKRWELAIYQAALLNVIFAFETGRDSVIRKSRLLLSLLVTNMREKGCLRTDAIEAHRLRFFPGDFPPWVYRQIEQWKRIAAYTFRIDVYISLFYRQPSTLRFHELEIGLLTTPTMFDSYTIAAFFDRSRYEPWSRGALNIPQLDLRKPEVVPGGTLPEDIRLYALGMWNDVWSLTKEDGAFSTDTSASKKMDLSQRLELSLNQLDYILRESNRPLEAGEHTATILRAYMSNAPGEEQDKIQEARSLVAGSIANIKPLLLLMNIHLHADTTMLREMYLARRCPTAQAWPERLLVVQEWAASAEGRTAVLAALRTWCTYETSLLTSPLTHSYDPIVYLALSTAATVLWAWWMNNIAACICDPAIPKTEICSSAGISQKADLQNWIQVGGSISILGKPVCRCGITPRIESWAKALETAGQTWEAAGIDADTLRAVLSR